MLIDGYALGQLHEARRFIVVSTQGKGELLRASKDGPRTHGRLAKYRAAASTQVSNTSSASRPRALPSVGRKIGYPPLSTAPTIMRLSGRWKPSMPRPAWSAPSCLRMRDSKFSGVFE